MHWVKWWAFTSVHMVPCTAMKHRDQLLNMHGWICMIKMHIHCVYAKATDSWNTWMQVQCLHLQVWLLEGAHFWVQSNHFLFWVTYPGKKMHASLTTMQKIKGGKEQSKKKKKKSDNSGVHPNTYRCFMSLRGHKMLTKISQWRKCIQILGQCSKHVKIISTH